VPIYKKVNKNFFKKWTPEMAYVLGFFAADGNIITNNRGAQFWTIEIKDKELLENIKETIESNHKISLRYKGDKGTHSIMYRLQIGSIKMCEDLRLLGFKERKTRSLIVPKVPDKYFSHFVRGYFDGDGNIWTGLVHKDRKTNTRTIRAVFTSCSKAFLQDIKNKLEKMDIKKGILSRGKGDYHRLTYSVHGSLKLYDFMYNMVDTSLFLKRKKDVFEKFVEMRS
jgi:intein-encoded DNA endonuclease-like protein